MSWLKDLVEIGFDLRARFTGERTKAAEEARQQREAEVAEQLAKRDARIAELEAKNARLVAENAKLEQELAKLRTPPDQGRWGGAPRLRGRME